jgi:hypothetical protein
LKSADWYLKFIRWSDEDRAHVDYFRDLFPCGGVCHGATEEAAYRKFRLFVREEVAQLPRKGKSLPPISARPMRDAVVA